MNTIHFEIYIDRDFVKEVDGKQLAFDRDPDLQDFYRFLTKLQGVDIITNYDSLDELEKVVDSSPFWLRLYDGTVIPIIRKDFCNEIGKSSFYENSTGFKLFFVERDDVDALSRNFGLLYINSSNLLKIWRYFSDERDDLALPITDNPDCDPKFDNWSYLQNFTHPFNSLILCDRYVLQNKGAFRSNLFALFQSLPCRNLNSSDLEVIIISELTHFTRDNNIDEYAELIKKQLVEWMRIGKLNITVLKLTNNENFYREHGRGLITNYWYINPQNSFNFFRYDANTRTTNLTLSDNIDFRFVFRKSTRNLLKERLRVIGDIVRHTHDEHGVKKVYTTGSRASRLLAN
ncbi:hypothetical protein GCM10027341_10140 [Spirosoma knui]